MPDPLPPPPDLPEAEQAIWTDYAQRLADQGTTPDPAHLRTLTAAIHQHQTVTRILNQTTPIIERRGQLIESPLLRTAERTERRIARLLPTLGLTTRDDPAASRIGGQRPIGGRSAKQQPGPDEHWGARYCEEHDRWECTGQKSRGRGQCHEQAMAGLNTCYHHQGGNAKIKHLVAVTQREGAKLGGPLPGGRQLPDVHPADALMYQVRYWAGMCDWLDGVLAGLDEGTMVWGMTRRVDVQGGEFPGVTVVEQAGRNAWADWHERAHRLLADVCAKALAAEVDAAALRLQQAQGMQAFRAFQAGLQKLGLSAAQWETARRVMPEVLRALVAA